MNPSRFDQRVALITGAGGGLGRAHALELARRGAKVVVNDMGGTVNGMGGDQCRGRQGGGRNPRRRLRRRCEPRQRRQRRGRTPPAALRDGPLWPHPSAAGLYGNFGQTNYGAAKLGIVGLMNSLAGDDSPPRSWRRTGRRLPTCPARGHSSRPRPH